MFQSGRDRRAREEELLRQRNILGAMRQAVAWIADSSESAAAMLQDIGKSQEKIDQSLDQVVSAVHKAQEEERLRSGAGEGLRGRLSELTDSVLKGENLLGQGAALAGEQHQRLQEALEKSGQMKEAFMGTDRRQEKIAALLEESQKDMEAMKEHGRTMSVLALNAAIEAGRMGEPGRQFVAASEDVRGCAEEYKRTAARVSGQLAQMKKELGNMAEQLSRLEKEFGEHYAGLKDVGQGFGQCVERLTGEGLAGHASKLMELGRDWEQEAGEAAGSVDYYGQILKHLEAAGEEYVQEQQLLERLNSLQEQIMEAIKERRTWG